ncbi:MAG TPA: YhdP family protein [Ottowia sp.]|uniref:YhdP family protein n=1 Tax=Ottowia sp. TaxID=1898956 RepID=UPI002BAF294A|nr:YhdP family protein [Ottowia sp.]HMN21782.1 YhdP family protein [Ottowia sp.]
MIRSPLRRVAAAVARWSLRAALALWLLAVIAWASLHWFIVPRIDDFRPRLEQLATRALGAPVVLGALRAESNGLVPTISVHAAQVLGAAGQPALEVARLLVTVSIGSLLRGELAQLVIDQPELELRRDRAGRLWLAGFEISATDGDPNPALDWVFAQEEILVRGGRLRWLDEQQGAAPVMVTAIDAVLRNPPRRHEFRVDATPDPGWGERLTLVGQFRQPLLSRHAGDWRAWNGQLHASLPRLDLGRLAQLALLPPGWQVDLQAGTGALRLWLDVRHGAPVGATVDLGLTGLDVVLGADLPALRLARLQGRLDWHERDGGFELGTRGLQFVEADGTAWPGGNFRLRQVAATTAPASTLQADRLDLAALARLADRLPLPLALRERLRQQPVSGQVQALQARWQGTLTAPADWRVQVRFTDLAIGARAQASAAAGAFEPGVPGIDGAALELDATPGGGELALQIRAGGLEFPGVFEQPRIALAELTAQARWRIEGERIALEVPELVLRNDDASGRFSARWHSGEDADGGGPRWPGVLDLRGAFSRASAAAVHRYLPLSLPAEARHYVRDAIRQGEGRDIAVQVSGKLREVPFNLPGEVGEFRFAGPVSGVTMAYVPRGLQSADEPPWPPLEALAGELLFERAGMRVQGASAAVQGHPGWRFAGIEATIADFKQERVQVRAEGRGALDAGLGIVRASPVAAYTRHALDDARGTRDAVLGLQLDLPLERLAESRVRGHVTLAGNDLRFGGAAPLLAQAHGTVRFTEQGFAIEDARVQALGGQAVVSGGTEPSDAAGTSPVLVRARGSASAEGLRAMTQWGPVAELARHASGSADYTAEIRFDAATPDIVVHSDLHGLALALPQPLAKAVGARWPLRYASNARAGAEGAERLQLRVADRLAVEYETTAATPARVLRGAVALGAAALGDLALPERGVRAWIELPELDADAWLALRPEPAGDADAPAEAYADALPSRWSVRVDELRAGARRLHALAATLTHEQGRWRVDAHARELDGRIDYIEGAGSDPGTLRARLARLSLPAETETETEAEASARPQATQPSGRLPALDVEIEDFELRGKKLGRLEVQAVNRETAPAADGATAPAREWQLSRLALVTPQAQLQASGRWLTGRAGVRDGGAANDTALDFRLEVEDAGALLERFGMHEVLRGGHGQIAGRLGWAGSPTAPHYPSLDGQVHIDVQAGQFLKAEPGIAKLLGVLSLQALPRRLTLDFRDVFSSGFAFDYVRSDAQVRRGVASTENLQMKGVNAAVLMDGHVDLARETQTLRVLVVPEIDAGTAALAATLINPAIGIGAFLAQLVLKGPLAQAATREFRITGSWDNPDIQSVQAPAAETVPAPGEHR